LEHEANIWILEQDSHIAWGIAIFYMVETYNMLYKIPIMLSLILFLLFELVFKELIFDRIVYGERPIKSLIDNSFYALGYLLAYSLLTAISHFV
jgi:hypothetical protein